MIQPEFIKKGVKQYVDDRSFRNRIPQKLRSLGMYLGVFCLGIELGAGFGLHLFCVFAGIFLFLRSDQPERKVHEREVD